MFLVGCTWLLSVVHAQPIFDVRTYGALPDDGQADRTGVERAIAAAHAAGGGMVYFPAGKYTIDNLTITGARRVTLAGEGDQSLIVRMLHGGETRIATFIGVEDFTIRDLAFDANGQQRFGGIAFFATRRVTIERTRYFDRDPAPYSPSPDRYAWVFGYGGTAHMGIVFRENRVEDLQVEIDDATDVEMRDNTIVRSDFTGTGSYGLPFGDGRAFTHVRIVGNTFRDCARFALMLSFDHTPADRVERFTFRDILVADNLFIYTTHKRPLAGSAIRFGANDNSLSSTGNVFQDVRIERNSIYIAPDAHAPNPLIFGNLSGVSGFKFLGVVVQHNRIYYNGLNTSIDVRRIPGDDVVIMGNIKAPWRPLPPRDLVTVQSEEE
jgi:hypothetical protein